MKTGLVVSLCLSVMLVGCKRESPGQRTENQPPKSQPSVQLSERGTPDEAKAMLRKAADHYDSVGRKQALADFTGKQPPFADRDLYVVCIGPDRRVTANGGFPQYVGHFADLLKDANGKSIGKDILESVTSKGESSVRYVWINPVSRRPEPKVLFTQKMGDDVCGVGAYNPE